MDIHRCRFIPYPAIAINALAFSHPSSSSKQRDDISLRLAIGRANGDIEIWNPLSGIWHQEVIIPGGKDRSIDGLVWTSEADEQGSDGKVVPGKLRLFSIGYTTAVTEWDLEKLRAKRHASGQHGEIWCISSQPPSSTPAGTAGAVAQKLLAGTIDGCLALYSIENDDLQLQRVIVKSPSKKTKMVSITFQSRHVAIVGCSDSSIRAYDVRNGTIIRHMTLGSDLVSGAKEIIAWSVKCLPNGDIVSGDSTGQVCIWDGRTYTLAQRIQSHQQDVLSLATSVDGSVIMSGGMDRRTVVYRAMSGAAGRWTKVSHRRYHKHDVKAMASFEGEGLSVAVSGGKDHFAPFAYETALTKSWQQVQTQTPLSFLCRKPGQRTSARYPYSHSGSLWRVHLMRG
jgi:U3 small nucleolar RNA-associated protein 4